MLLNLQIVRSVCPFYQLIFLELISGSCIEMNLTSQIRGIFVKHSERTDNWNIYGEEIQRQQLLSLLHRAASTEVGRKYRFDDIILAGDPYLEFARSLAPVEYEDIRADVERMLRGEKNVLWPGKCNMFAQSSGTSGGKSKYIPITNDSLRNCHYKGARDSVAHYLRLNPNSRLFSGKAMILGGSYANELNLHDPRVRVGDLSATLIDRINPMVNLFRIPDKKVALMPDWREKLPALVEAAKNADVTNISGVPSWFLTVIKEICKARGVEKISEVWPNLEVFFHGGISFAPYREEYRNLTAPNQMHFLENYNASEGFFALQNDMSDPAMLLTIDNDIFYEFIDLDNRDCNPKPLWELEAGKVYELLISSSNGLWRYRTGDTVRVVSTAPVKILVAGRTKCYINAFGEELMQENAERGMAEVCGEFGCSAADYTVAPLFAEGNRHGRHQWFVEWTKRPDDAAVFAKALDNKLRSLNSDYDAKRSNDIFLDNLEIIEVPKGTFDRWLNSVGSGKLGGQRKIPRLSNDRKIAEQVLTLLE